MISLQARAFAMAGFNVLVPDLFGTGDSDGEFADARFEIWTDDLVRIVDDVSSESNAPILWSIRTGALLAAEALAQFATTPSHLLAWSPVVSGETFITQFLRMKSLSQKLAGSEDVESVADLRDQLSAGQAVEVAGYSLDPALINRLDGCRLTSSLADFRGRVDWFEMVADENRAPSAAARRSAGALSDGKSSVNLHAAVGPNFWTTAEIATSPHLIDVTTLALAGEAPS